MAKEWMGSAMRWLGGIVRVWLGKWLGNDYVTMGGAYLVSRGSQEMASGCLGGGRGCLGGG